MYKKCAQLVETWVQNRVHNIAQFPHKVVQSPKSTKFSKLYTGQWGQKHRNFRTLYTAKIREITDQVSGLYTVCTQPITTTTTYINKKKEYRKEHS